MYFIKTSLKNQYQTTINLKNKFDFKFCVEQSDSDRVKQYKRRDVPCEELKTPPDYAVCCHVLN